MGCNQSTNNVAEPRRIATSNQPVDYGDGGAGGGNRVRLPAPWKSEQPITQAKLDMDRATFWDTTPKVQGNARVWEALRVACDAQLARDIDLCNAVLEAGDIRVPHGTLAMCYDARGFLYELPLFCFSSPTNILSLEEASMPKRVGHHTGSVQTIPIMLRLSSTPKTSEQDIPITVQSNERIGAVKQRLNQELLEGRHDDHTTTADTPPTMRRGEGNKWAGVGLNPTHQRWYCQGKQFPDDCIIQECNLQPHMIVQVFIKTPLR